VRPASADPCAAEARTPRIQPWIRRPVAPEARRRRVVRRAAPRPRDFRPDTYAARLGARLRLCAELVRSLATQNGTGGTRCTASTTSRHGLSESLSENCPPEATVLRALARKKNRRNPLVHGLRWVRVWVVGSPHSSQLEPFRGLVAGIGWVASRFVRRKPLPHPARAEWRQDFVGAEASPGSKRHERAVTGLIASPPPGTCPANPSSPELAPSAVARGRSRRGHTSCPPPAFRAASGTAFGSSRRERSGHTGR